VTRTPGIDPATLRLRPVEPRDREVLMALWATTRERELALLPLAEPARAAFVRQQFEAQDRSWRAAYPGARFDVVLDRGTVVGRLYVDRSPDAIHVIDIALLPELHGRGLGTHLLGRLVAESEADGIPLTLHVDRMNRALRLYARLGFEVARDEGPYHFMRRSPVLS